MNQTRSDAEVLSRFVAYEPPQSGFDLTTAPDHLLRKHGFPRRPDPDKEPELHQLWQKAFSRPMQMIKAELAVDRVRPPRDRLLPTRPFDIKGGWAGAIVNPASLFSPEPGGANTVYGQWIIPSVARPPNLSQDLIIGFWVGLGGNALEGSTQVVQAGVKATSHSDNSVSYLAWTEWWSKKYQDPAVTVKNFPVDAGDHVEFLVCTPQPDRAFVSMRNFTSGMATSVGIQADPGITNDGTSAEWVVEGLPPELLDFYSVTFGQCLGATQQHSFDLTTATTLGISSSDPNRTTYLAQAYLLLSNAAIMVWNDFGP